MRNIDLIFKLLNEISKINEIENIELINVPEDVDAYVSLKIKPKNIKDRYKILEKLNYLEWEFVIHQEYCQLFIESLSQSIKFT